MTAPQLTQYVQGQGSVSADGLNTFEQTCNNVAQLRAFVGVTGMQVFVRGFTNPNDGGGGSFYWNASATGPDDGVNTIVPTGAAIGAWVRIIELVPGPTTAIPVNANKIINGDFAVDQRNGYALVVVANNTYYTDRWMFFSTQANKLQFQALNLATNAGSLGLPLSTWGGFTVYNGAYVTNGNDYFGCGQQIEGYNITDLLWGTPQAKPATLSFYVYCTVAGDYSLCVRNVPATHSYLVKYNVPVANVFTKIVIPIPGPTVGTWSTGASGVILIFTLDGAGTALTAPGGGWTAAVLNGAIGQTKMLSTAGAAFALSGVKFELGSIVTPFVPDDFEVSLAKCQRYYRKLGPGLATRIFATGQAYAAANAAFPFVFSPTMRVAPTFNSAGNLASTLAAGTPQPATLGGANFAADGGRVDTITTGLVAGNASDLVANADATAILTWDAEL